MGAQHFCEQCKTAATRRQGQVSARGVATEGYIGIYTPKISLPYKFLCGYWLFFSLFDRRSSYSARGTLT